jgi:hypothetical protein
MKQQLENSVAEQAVLVSALVLFIVAVVMICMVAMDLARLGADQLQHRHTIIVRQR